jgi:hypothetical protein
MTGSGERNGFRRPDGTVDMASAALAVYFVALIVIVAVLLIVSALP